MLNGSLVQYVPEWCPGTAWKQKAKKYRALLEDMLAKPFELVKQNMVRVFGILAR